MQHHVNTILNLVDAAMEDRRVSLAVQGIHAVADRKDILFGECLAAIRKPDGAMLPPSSFIPYLERAGCLPNFDAHVLSMVLDALESDSDISLGCNLSVANFHDTESWNRIMEQIDMRAHLAPRLVLEITETVDFADIAEARAMLTDAKGLGCLFAIDDFGSGHATPARLLALDIDIVKIDQLFVRDIRTGHRDSNSLQHMVGLAGCVAPFVVVEGIETQEHHEIARAAGATHLQGYLLSRPVAIEPTNRGKIAQRTFPFLRAAE